MKNILNMQYIMFYSFFLISILLALSSNTFTGLWMSMEINMFSFIILMNTNNKKMLEKSTMIYFLTQSISSSLILLSFLLSFKEMEKPNFLLNFVIISVFLKVGLFPFHLWTLQIVENMSWKTCFILLTFQKIIPLMAFYNMNQEKMILIILVINSVMASKTGLTTYSLRKICVVSSMNHLSFLMLMMILSKKTFKIYFLIYMFSNMIMMKIFSSTNLNYMFHLMKKNKKTKITSMSLLITLLSLMGIPPFLGFMPKMMSILKMVELMYLFPTFLMLVNNTFMAYMYLRLTISTMLMMKNMNKNLNKKEHKMNIMFLLLIMSPFTFMM
uniref:NADH dehydrogenase subunit 2 n=1 Tax=Bregmatothrips sinensis TaxID=3045418 RepID=UPI0030E50C83